MESCCSVVIPKTPSKLNRAPPRNCLPWESCNTRCLFHTRIRVAPVGRCYAGELDKIRSQDYSLGLYPCLKRSSASTSKKFISTITRCSGDDKDETSNSKKTPFGYTRKDVILIGVGVTAAGVGLKSGLEYAGVDPLQAGNVVQLVLVLGLTVGWISTYIFRVGNKEMTYAQQLRDYEVKVMEKRLESLTEAEIQVLLEQVEEEKQRLTGGEQVK